ncbi:MULTISPECIES: cupin domain-containing protein [unclassified Saccharicrinis]|uniref:cupin domain-containing protein n=1 Tax=unclassified Saccharicrinis TaxID=2646859 RepID=UPI003D34E435
MDRKTFLKKTGMGLGLAVAPMLASSQMTTVENKMDKVLNPKIIRGEEGDVLNVIGDIQTHKLLGSDTNNQIVEWVDNVGPGVGIPPHIHTNEDEIFRVIKGSVEIMVDGEISVLNAGDMAFAPKNIPHAWNVVGTEMAQMITSAFPAGIEKMFEELANLEPGKPDFEKVAQICGKHGITFLPH